MATVLQKLSEGLTSEDVEVREESASALAELADPDAAPLLARALGDEAEQVRRWGAYGLGMLARPDDLPLVAFTLMEDPDPVVQVWSAFGVARCGGAEGLPRLLRSLEHPNAEARSNAADALLSLDRPREVRRHLAARLTGESTRARPWAAAILHRLGEPRALDAWRAALGSPEARVDAAMAAPLLQEPEAARALLRLLVSLPSEQLEEATHEEGPLLAEALSSPLLSLDLESVLERAREDDALRGELILLLARHSPIDRQVFDLVHEFVALLPSEQLGREVSALLAGQDELDRPAMLSNVATLIPDAVEPALENMDLDIRKSLFRRVVEQVQSGSEEGQRCAALVERLRETKYADAVAQLPAPEPGEAQTDPLTPAAARELDALVHRLATGENLTEDEHRQVVEFLAHVKLTPEKQHLETRSERAERTATPPEPSAVAGRALAVAAVLHRLHAEQDLAAKKVAPADAARALESVRRWLETHELGHLLTPGELELLDPPLGSWTADELTSAAWAAEELATLLWALKRAQRPPLDHRVDGRSLLAKVPLHEPASAFVQRADLVDAEELELQAELWTAWKDRAEQETLTRHVRANPTAELERDVANLVRGLATEGFDSVAAEKAQGRTGALVEGLRFLGRLTAKRMKKAGALPKLVDGDVPFRGKAFAAITNDELAEAHALANERLGALRWIATGDRGDDLDLDLDASEELRVDPDEEPT